MAKMKIPRGLYLTYRFRADNTPVFRWGMAPGLRKQGVKAIDLMDDRGQPLALKAAIERAAELTHAVKSGKPQAQPKASAGSATVGDLVEAFLDPRNLDAMLSPKTGAPLAKASKNSYRGWAPAIIETFQDEPIAGVTEDLLGQWYDTVKKTRGHAMAYSAFALMRQVMTWERKTWRQPDIDWKEAGKAGRVSRPPLKLRWATPDELACLLTAMDNPEILYQRLADEGRPHTGTRIPARPELGDTLVAAVWTLQRKSTVLGLTEFMTAGQRVRGQAQKNQKNTRKVFDVPQLGPLPQRLKDAAARKAARGLTFPEIFAHPHRDRAYDDDDHNEHFRQARALAAKFFPSLIGEGVDAFGRQNLTFTFEDCRDTGITRLLNEAGCTLEEVIAWSNHASVDSLMALRAAYFEFTGITSDRAGAKVTAWWDAAGGRV